MHEGQSLVKRSRYCFICDIAGGKDFLWIDHCLDLQFKFSSLKNSTFWTEFGTALIFYQHNRFLWDLRQFPHVSVASSSYVSFSIQYAYLVPLIFSILPLNNWQNPSSHQTWQIYMYSAEIYGINQAYNNYTVILIHDKIQTSTLDSVQQNHPSG